MNNGYFDIKRDIEVINKGGFFCQACAVGKTEDKMSQDSRYCLDCYKLLLKEAALLSGQPKWRPRSVSTTAKISPQNTQPIPTHTKKVKEVLLHTKHKNTHAYQNPTRDVVINLGGRPQKDIPVQLIRKLSEEGLTIKPIVRELKRRGHLISPMSVSRVLSGERN